MKQLIYTTLILTSTIIAYGQVRSGNPIKDWIDTQRQIRATNTSKYSEDRALSLDFVTGGYADKSSQPYLMVLDVDDIPELDENNGKHFATILVRQAVEGSKSYIAQTPEGPVVVEGEHKTAEFRLGVATDRRGNIEISVWGKNGKRWVNRSIESDWLDE
ncbi:MAG: hypothetical protein HUJ26_18920 [Planctomycetaceae bacterium]|nr:hypothetical protein [Planctomycetaceae bacterium]